MDKTESVSATVQSQLAVAQIDSIKPEAVNLFCLLLFNLVINQSIFLLHYNMAV